MCSVYKLETDSTLYCLLPCHHLSKIRSTLQNSITEIIGGNPNPSDGISVKVSLFGDQKYTEVGNSLHNQRYY